MFDHVMYNYYFFSKMLLLHHAIWFVFAVVFFQSMQSWCLPRLALIKVSVWNNK